MGFFDFLRQKAASRRSAQPNFGFSFSGGSGESRSKPIIVTPARDMAAARAKFREYAIQESPSPESMASTFSDFAGPSANQITDELMTASERVRYLETRFGTKDVDWAGIWKGEMDEQGLQELRVALPDGRNLTLFFDLSALGFPKGRKGLFL